ncbi:MAG: hypothetical protein IJW12_03980 [Opitutales bacterium]|nr:hypothetical protein [Opitutales bacterium]
MLAPQQAPKETKVLSEEDLRALARRHMLLLRKFNALRERENLRKRQEAEVISLAQRMAAEMLYQNAAQSAAPCVSAAQEGVPAVPASPASATGAENSVRGNAEDDASEAEIAEDVFSDPQKAPVVHHFEAPLEVSETVKVWRKIGGGSLAFSLIFHAVLIFFAIFYVVSTYVAPPEEPPSFFATGSGGGRGGERPSYADVQASRRKSVKINAGTQSRKIVSKVANAKFALPELPETAAMKSFSGNTLTAGGMHGLGGDLSSGSGGGLGGGIGAGTGVGIGNSRNFVSKFQTTQKILGTNVTAGRLAVYMDSSGSMTEVLPVVREEILKKFPTADVFEFMGCGMGQISGISRSRLEQGAWERKKKSLLNSYEREKKPSASRKAMKAIIRKNKKARKNGIYDYSGGGNEWAENLSSYGKALLSEWSGNDYSSWLALGRWLEMVLSEGGYDSVIVFADFQDYRDGQIPDESALFERWLKLAQDNGQRVYFFTTEMLPQNIFRALADYTNGDIAIPKDTAKNSKTAQETEDFLKKTRRKQNRLKTNLGLLSVPGKFEIEYEEGYDVLEPESETEEDEGLFDAS